MKDLETTWSHILWKKFAKIREERGMSQIELSEKIGVAQTFVSSVLWRQKKWSEDFFTKCGKALWLPDRQVQDMLRSAMFEAMDQEYGAGIQFALKTKYNLSEKWMHDVMKCIDDIKKAEGK